MARMVKTGTRIGPSKSSQSLSIAHKWAVVIDLRAICLLSFIIILLGFSGHQNGFKIAFNSILQFPAAGLTVDYFSIDILTTLLVRCLNGILNRRRVRVIRS
ncbi:hypothetical protein Tco_0749934 [Tanacetum coccineum]|uniref:Uncharacterized protein n=1 Tax=Tanacetum coccineum TaxID=301880 RepID=A0ABQ4Z3H0_9ASTR